MLAPSENILIVSLRRSGGKLLRMLLDGHPAIRALPFEHWHTAKKGECPGHLLKLFRLLSVERKLALTGIRRMALPKIRRTHGAAGASEFERGLVEDTRLASNSADLYQRFVDRYFRSFHGIVGLGPRVVNHCGNLALMTPAQLDQVFGSSTKVIVWRDPRAAYVSSKAAMHKSARQKPHRQANLDFCREYATAYAHYGCGPEFSLKFEDLVREPERCMRSLASALDIEFCPSLLTPSILGAPTGANTSFERAHGVIDASAAADWESRIDPADRAVIEDRLGYIIDAFGWPSR